MNISNSARSLGGLQLSKSAPVPSDHRRDPNVMHGVSSTRFSINSITQQREMVVSKPPEVIAMRVRSSKKGQLEFHC